MQDLYVDTMNVVDMEVHEEGAVSMSTDQTTRIVEAISPVVDVSRIEGGVKITVVDKEGTKEATVNDGAKGDKGDKGDKGNTGDTGEQGEPGVTPSFSIGTVQKGEDAGATITGTDANPVLNLTLPKGDKGDTGNTGPSGEDGFSPTVSVSTIAGGHQIAVTDGSGTETFDVMDGADGQDGQAGQDGVSAYCYVRWAANQPTSDSDMTTTPSDWMGIYSGDAASAPSHYTDYQWYKVKGETGSAANVYGNTIPMSSTDSTKVATAIAAKADLDQGSANAGKVMRVNSSGNMVPDDEQSISGKADKVGSATSGNFAGLDASGNLTDSGHKHSDYITSHQDISGKADKVSGATTNNFAALDANGNLKDSGHKHSDYLTSHQDISGKADKVSGATSGDFAALDSAGNLTDSGIGPDGFFYVQSGSSSAAQAYKKGDYILVAGSLSKALTDIASGASFTPANLAPADAALSGVSERAEDTAGGIGWVEDTNTAVHAIAKDEYVLWKGDLHKATAAISVGDTLSSSNLDSVSGGLGAEVASLNAHLENLVKSETVTVTFGATGLADQYSIPSGITVLCAISSSNGIIISLARNNSSNVSFRAISNNNGVPGWYSGSLTLTFYYI